MGDSDREKAAAEDRRTSKGEYDRYITDINPVRSDLYDYTMGGNHVNPNSELGKADAGFTNFANTGGLSAEDLQRVRDAYSAVGGGAAGGGGGVSNSIAGRASSYAGLSSALKGLHSQYASLGPSAYSGISSAAGNVARPDYTQSNNIYAGLGSGGLSSGDTSSVNRDTLQEFEKTGGYSDAAIGNVRAQAASNAPSYFSAIKDNMARNRAVTGNLAGGQALDFKLARQGAQQSNQDRTAAEIGLQDSIRSGRMGASTQLAQNNLGLLGLRSSNQIAGAGGLAGNATAGGQFDLNRAGLQDQFALGQAGGLDQYGLSKAGGMDQFGLQQGSGLDQFGLTQAGGLDQYAVNQAGLNMSAGGTNASLAQQAQIARARGEQDLLSMKQGGQQYGTTGLAGLYSTNLGAMQNYDALHLNALNSKYNTSNQNIQLMSPGFDWRALAGGVGGAIGGL